MNENIKSFELGRDAGLDAIEEIELVEHIHMSSAFVGLMTCVMHCVYFHAPCTEAAEKLIATAQTWGKQDAMSEKNEN